MPTGSTWRGSNARARPRASRGGESAASGCRRPSSRGLVDPQLGQVTTGGEHATFPRQEGLDRRISVGVIGVERRNVSVEARLDRVATHGHFRAAFADTVTTTDRPGALDVPRVDP